MFYQLVGIANASFYDSQIRSSNQSSLEPTYDKTQVDIRLFNILYCTSKRKTPPTPLQLFYFLMLPPLTAPTPPAPAPPPAAATTTITTPPPATTNNNKQQQTATNSNNNNNNNNQQQVQNKDHHHGRSRKWKNTSKKRGQERRRPSKMRGINAKNGKHIEIRHMDGQEKARNTFEMTRKHENEGK